MSFSKALDSNQDFENLRAMLERREMHWTDHDSSYHLFFQGIYQFPKGSGLSSQEETSGSEIFVNLTGIER